MYYLTLSGNGRCAIIDREPAPENYLLGPYATKDDAFGMLSEINARLARRRAVVEWGLIVAYALLGALAALALA